MRRLSLVSSFALAALVGCSSESNSGLFSSPNGNSATGGSNFGGMAGTGGAGGPVTGGSAGFGASTASGGLFGAGGSGGTTGPVEGGAPGGAGGAIGGSAGVTGSGGIVQSGGAPGTGGLVATGGLSGTGGANDTGGSTGSGGNGGSTSTYAPGAAADCNGTPCATASGAACCVIVSTNNGKRTVYATCTPAGGACTVPLSAKARCDGPEDCAAGSVCCGTAGLAPGIFTELGCVPEASCMGTGNVVMCHPQSGSSCGSGSCGPTLTLPDGYGMCG